VNSERFRNSPIGRLEPIKVFDGDQTWEHVAFVPAPLPHELDLSQQAWTSVTDATAAVSRLDGAAHRLPNPYLLVRPALTKEAVATSALEGTYAAVEDVFEAEFIEESEISASTAEVRNYVLAAELGIDMIRTLPISRRLVTQTHGVLMRGSRGDHAEIGAFRRRQNWIGARRQASVTEALFVPPPAGEILDRGIDDWERWVNDASVTLPVVVRAALAHYQFETLHPFIDGNGRIGRLLIVLMFIEAGVLKIPLLNVSPFLEQARDEYIDHLRTVSETGDFEPWIRFFAEVVRVQSEAALAKADSLIGARDEMIASLHGANVRGVAIRIAEDLVGNPYITATRAAQRFSVTYEGANSAISRLVNEKVLVEVTGRSYGRVFMAPKIVSIISR
jgi:Fic family protein